MGRRGGGEAGSGAEGAERLNGGSGRTHIRPLCKGMLIAAVLTQLVEQKRERARGGVFPHYARPVT